MKKASADLQFDPPNLSKREAGVLRAALIKYAKDCDLRFQQADNPQDAYTAGTEAEAARQLALRIVRPADLKIVKSDQAVSRPAQPSALRPIR